MINWNSPSAARGPASGRKAGTGLVRTAFSTAALLALAGVAHAQTGGPAPAAADDSLTWHGITLYGIVDIGLQYQTHGTPISDYFPAGSAELIQKNSNSSVLGFTPNNFSQSRVGLSGKEPLLYDWSGVFRMETFFNPQSGEISDGLKSLTLNNGRALNVQNTGVDTSVAGQAFQQLYAGFSSPSFGTLTFGRQNTTFADAVAKYDPMGASQAFSVIGFSGAAAGGGDTEDRRLDQSLKYVLASHGLHLGAMYKFNGTNGSAATATEFQLGGEFAGLSADVYYLYIKDAIGAAALSAAQVAGLPALGYSSSNSLAATISDNTTVALTAMYSLPAPQLGSPKLYAGYEHILFANPTNPLAAGYVDEGGYILAFVNNAAFPKQKLLEIFWTGLKLTFAKNFDVIGAYYGYRQNSFATGTNVRCSTNQNAACSGTLNAGSVAVDWRMSKRFDVYAGAMWSSVSDGLSNGYLQTSTIDPTIGVRFKF
jgi:predicted porin